MIKRIKEWFGFGTNWKSLLIRSQEAILENVVKLNGLIFLRPDEIEAYISPMRFLHETAPFADEMVDVYKGDELIVHGLCIGYGALINNVVECDEVTSNIKRFYVIRTDEDKIITLEEGMTIDYAKN